MAYCQIFEHPDLTPEKMEQVMAHVRTRAAAAYVTAGAKQGLFHRLPDLGTGKQAIYRLPPTTAPGEDATS